MSEPKSHLDENCFVILDDDIDPDRPPHLAREAVAACELCDADGYRNGVVCDHQDHREAAERGMAKIREILGGGQ